MKRVRIERVQLMRLTRPLMPKRSRGRQSAAAEARYQDGLAAFCARIKQIRLSTERRLYRIAHPLQKDSTDEQREALLT
jgi:hypothetical protein